MAQRSRQRSRAPARSRRETAITHTPSQYADIDRKLHGEADRILHTGSLRALLSVYGSVHTTGSYDLGLMTWRDLDLYVVADTLPVTEFFALGGSIAILLSPVRMSYRMDIYEAVLAHDVANTRELADFVQERRQCDLDA